MAEWKTTVEIGDIHEAFEDDELTIQDVAELVAVRFKKNPYAPELKTEIKSLERLASAKRASVDRYDRILERLYNFGDIDHRIWIDTFRRGNKEVAK